MDRLLELEDKQPGPDVKQCATCGRWLDVESGFHLVQRAGASPIRRPDCRSCHNDQKRLRQRVRDSGQFDRMLLTQNHRCAACGDPIGAEAHVDHNHKTGKIRGLLCEPCNLGGGKLGDSLERTLLFALYLVRNDG